LRAREQLAKRQPDDVTRKLLALLEGRPAEPQYLARIAVRERERVRFVKTGDVDWFEASGNYVILHVGRENHVVRETLSALEAQLSPKEFLRLSRSAIVNLDRVQEVQPTFNDEHVVILHNGAKLPMTRGVRELQERLKFG
jgi:two-component system LytT family response regulator